MLLLASCGAFILLTIFLYALQALRQDRDPLLFILLYSYVCSFVTGSGNTEVAAHMCAMQTPKAALAHHEDD